MSKSAIEYAADHYREEASRHNSRSRLGEALAETESRLAKLEAQEEPITYAVAMDPIHGTPIPVTPPETGAGLVACVSAAFGQVVRTDHPNAMLHEVDAHAAIEAVAEWLERNPNLRVQAVSTLLCAQLAGK